MAPIRQTGARTTAYAVLAGMAGLCVAAAIATVMNGESLLAYLAAVPMMAGGGVCLALAYGIYTTPYRIPLDVHHEPEPPAITTCRDTLRTNYRKAKAAYLALRDEMDQRKAESDEIDDLRKRFMTAKDRVRTTHSELRESLQQRGSDV